MFVLITTFIASSAAMARIPDDKALAFTVPFSLANFSKHPLQTKASVTDQRRMDAAVTGVDKGCFWNDSNNNSMLVDSSSRTFKGFKSCAAKCDAKYWCGAYELKHNEPNYCVLYRVGSCRVSEYVDTPGYSTLQRKINIDKSGMMIGGINQGCFWNDSMLVDSSSRTFKGFESCAEKCGAKADCAAYELKNDDPNYCVLYKFGSCPESNYVYTPGYTTLQRRNDINQNQRHLEVEGSVFV
jgi:hypothetical protein